jgi:DNA-directed RNA polymerase subunit M/transcription elongation factor TFIIS
MYNIKMEKDRVVVCDKCGKELEVRWAVFANHTLSSHLREHEDVKAA